MKIDEYISSLRNKDIVVFVRDNRIAVNAPQGALTPEITAELTIRKQEILDFYESINAASNHENAESKSTDLDLASLEHFEEQELYDVAFQQRKEFFRFQHIGMYAFNIVIPVLIADMDREVLEASILALARRHEILRTVHVLENGIAKQKVMNDITIADYIAKPDPYKEEGIVEDFSQIMANCHAYPFEFEKDFLIAFQLGNQGEAQEGMIIILHHSIADAGAAQIVSSELMQIYDSLKNNREVQLPAVPVQPKEFAFLVKDLENSPGSKKFFIEKFKESLALNGDSYADVLNNEENRYRLMLDKEIEELYRREGLPHKLASEYVYGHIAHIIQERDGGKYSLFLNDEISDKIKALSGRYNTTLYMFVTSLYAALIGHLKGQKSVRMLAPFSKRTSKEVEHMVSWLTSESLACITIDEDLNMPDFIQSVSNTIVEVSQHKHYGHEKVMNDLDVTLDFMAPNFLNLVSRGEAYEKEPVIHEKENVYTHFHFDTTITSFSNGMLLHSIYKHAYFNSDEVEAFWGMISEMVDILFEKPDGSLKGLIDTVTKRSLAEI